MFATVKATLLNTALNMGIGLAISFAVKGLTTLIDSLIVTQAELDETADSLKRTYESTKSELESVNSELDGNKSRIKELESMGSLTYVEKSELESLKEANSLLESQIELLERKQAVEAVDSAKAVSDSITNKYTGLSYTSQDSTKFKNEFNKENFNDVANYVTEAKNNIISLMTVYEMASEQIDKINIIPDSEKTDEQIGKVQELYDIMTDSSDGLVVILSELSTALADMGDAYDLISDKEIQSISLTSDEKAIKETYEQIANVIDEINRGLDSNNYNSLQIDKIFDKAGIEATKEEIMALVKEAEDLESLDFSNMENLVRAIEDADLVLEDGQDNIAAFKEELLSLIEIAGEAPLSNAFDMSDGMDDTISKFDTIENALTNLADLQDALSDSFRLSREEARAFADIYPEILAMGEVTEKGVLQLNENMVNSFIEGKQAEIQAGNMTEIQKLEAAKMVLEAKKVQAEAELEIAYQVANGELSLEEGKVLALANSEKALTDYLIQLGVNEADAQKIAVEAQAGNYESLSTVVSQVAQGNYTNLSNSVQGAATATHTNATNMVSSYDAVGRQVSNVARAIAHMSGGVDSYDGKVSVGGGASGGAAFTVANPAERFKAVNGALQTATANIVTDWVDSLTLDISSYTNAINQIDSQIALLKTMDTDLSKYSSGKYAGSSAGSGSSGSSSKSDSSSKENTFSKTFDWLSRALEVVEERITKLGKTISNTYLNWGKRNSALSDELVELSDQLNLQTVAYNAYMSQANSVGLSEHYKNLVQNGAISIETITDEDLANKIEEYQKWYEAAQEAFKAIQDIEIALGDNFQNRFDNIVSEYDNILSEVEFKADHINNSLKEAETKGMLATASYYEYLINLESDTLKVLEEERKALLEVFSRSVADGVIEEGSEAWYDMKQQIYEVDLAIQDANLSILEFSNSIRDIQWELFDYLQDTISQITTEADFLASILKDDKLFSEIGEFTEKGLSLLALYGINYNTYMTQADKYADAIKELDKVYESDSLNTDYLKRRQELVELQQDMILNAEQEKQSMIALAEEGYNKQLSALKDLISARKELLSSQKDLYDYEKKIAEKTKEVSDIQKQLNAYTNDNSEETRKTVQQLKIELQQAKDDLEKTEYEKYLADQEALLDSLYNEFEIWINARLDDVNGLLLDLIDTVNANSDTVSDTLHQTASDLGYTLSNEFSTILNTNLGSDSAMYNMLSVYNDNFTSTMTTLQSAVNGINTNLSSMVALAEAEAKKAEEEVKAAAAAQEQASTVTSTPSSSTSTSGSSTPSSSSSSSSSTSSSSNTPNYDSIFVYKYDAYPKEKLNRFTSIIDGLKYFNYDSSYSQRGNYYRALGGSGSYSSTYDQNVWLLNKFRSIKGYSTGGIVGGLESIIKGNGDDMLTLNTLKKGEVILPVDMAPQWSQLIESLPYLNNLIDNVNTSGQSVIIKQILLQFDMNGITDYDGFKNRLISDKNFRNAVKTQVNNSIIGKSDLSSFKYKK